MDEAQTYFLMRVLQKEVGPNFYGSVTATFQDGKIALIRVERTFKPIQTTL